jgi:hypothetical protein
LPFRARVLRERIVDVAFDVFDWDPMDNGGLYDLDDEDENGGQLQQHDEAPSERADLTVLADMARAQHERFERRRRMALRDDFDIIATLDNSEEAEERALERVVASSAASFGGRRRPRIDIVVSTDDGAALIDEDDNITHIDDVGGAR